MKFYELLNDILGRKLATIWPNNVLNTFLDVTEKSDFCTAKSLESSSTQDISGLNDQSGPLEATKAKEGDEREESPVNYRTNQEKETIDKGGLDGQSNRNSYEESTKNK